MRKMLNDLLNYLKLPNRKAVMNNGHFPDSVISEYKLIRKIFTPISTIGELSHNGTFICYILEDSDRELYDTMPEEEIKKIKVKGSTCIPYGTYEMVSYYSPKLKKFVPLLEGVKGFEYIEIHTGNFTDDTLGCLLPGMSKGKDMVLSSRTAFSKLMALLDRDLVNNKKTIITITKDITA